MQPPPKVINKVLDLLDHDVLLSTETGDDVWEPEVFDTSQFTAIGVRASADVSGGSLFCHASWQFTADDEFIGAAPTTRGSAIGDDRMLATATLRDVKVLLRRD